MQIVATTELPNSWHWVANHRERAEVEAELSRELPTEHVLFGKPARLIARHDKRDDFLFRLGQTKVAQVHLTWSIETDPHWPHSEVHSTLADWAKTGGVMK